MAYALVTPPATEPVSLAEAKLHLKAETSADDTLISALIVAARQHIEVQLRRSLVTQTWRATFDGFPRASEGFRLLKGPVQSVTSVAYVDDAGVTRTLAGSVYAPPNYDDAVPVLALAPDQSWPSYRRQQGAVTVTYVAGYGSAAAVPQAIKQAILFLVGHWYAFREAVIVGEAPAALPLGVEALIADFVLPLMA